MKTNKSKTSSPKAPGTFLLKAFLLCLLFIPLFVVFADSPEPEPVVCNQDSTSMVCSNSTYSSLGIYGMKYYTGSEWLPVNTTAYYCNKNGYEYCVDQVPYQLYYRAHSNWGDGVKYCVNDSGTQQCVTYQAQDYSYRDVYGSQDYISSISDVTGNVSGNTMTFKNVYTNVTLEYQTYNTELKELYTLSSLPKQPATWLTAPVTLDFGGYVKFGSLSMYVNGSQKTGDFITNSTIEFRNASNVTLFFMPSPIAYDSNGAQTSAQYEVKDQEAQIWFYVRTPFLWLNSSERAWPVFVDPSLQINSSNPTTLNGSLTYTEVNITDGGVLSITSYDGTPNTGWLNLTVNRMYVDSSSIITANLSGYSGGAGGTAGSCPGSSCYDPGDGGQPGNGDSKPTAGGSGTSQAHYACGGGGAGGSGYGGTGSNGAPGNEDAGSGCTGGSAGNGGSTYGDLSTDVINISYMGSGAGGGGGGGACAHDNPCTASPGDNGQPGGGSIRIVSDTGTIEIHGKVVAIGGSGGSGGSGCNIGCAGDGYQGGGGSGGSGGQIIIKGRELNLSSALINVSGGSGGSGGYSSSGRGGGGRIKVWYNTSFDNSSMVYDVAGANAGSYYVASFASLNTPPVPVNVTITPIGANNTDDLFCDYDYTDNNSDSEQGQWFLWWKNGAATGNTSQVLGSGNTSIWDNWTCSVMVSDGIDNSTWENSSHVTIQDNIEPMIYWWNLSAPSGYTTDTINIYVNCSDTSSSIVYARVSFINPNGDQVANKTMVNQVGNMYNYSYNFNLAGNWINFTFWCLDSSGNLNGTNTSLVFTATTPPTTTLPGGGGGGSTPPLNVTVFELTPIGNLSGDVPLGIPTSFSIRINNTGTVNGYFLPGCSGDGCQWVSFVKKQVLVNANGTAILRFDVRIPSNESTIGSMYNITIEGNDVTHRLYYTITVTKPLISLDFLFDEVSLPLIGIVQKWMLLLAMFLPAGGLYWLLDKTRNKFWLSSGLYMILAVFVVLAL